MEKEKFWNTAEFLAKSDVYCDWEGFASADGLEEKVREAIKIVRCERDDPEIIQIVGDVVMHYVYESVDKADTMPSMEALYEIAYIVYEMVTVKNWMKSGIKW